MTKIRTKPSIIKPILDARVPAEVPSTLDKTEVSKSPGKDLERSESRKSKDLVAVLQSNERSDDAESTRKADRLCDLLSPELYLNRELTWLGFNQRVLHEAWDVRTPLLERLKFVAIVSNNLDEFFMKRIGGLKQQQGAGIRSFTVDGRTPGQQISESYVLVRQLEGSKQKLLPQLLSLLKERGISLLSFDELSAEKKIDLRKY